MGFRSYKKGGVSLDVDHFDDHYLADAAEPLGISFEEDSRFFDADDF
ncbi:MAG: hypothetical protein NC930_00580 [Candidatus Omnitrophica bacterium]|nr:hypothetical protein [Candidatus Omnitrophota bacterium]